MKLILPPVLIVSVLGVIGLACLLTQQAWLAPSIGAAVFTQVFLPTEPGAKPYGIFVGQIIGVACGFLAVYAVHATTAPQFVGEHDLSRERLLAILIAVALASTFQVIADAKSPAGGATALVVAIGSETADVLGAFRLLVGVVVVTILGEAARRLLLLASKRSRAQAADPCS